MYYKEYSSPIGKLTLASDGATLAGLWLEGQKYFGGPLANTLTPGSDFPVFLQTIHWLDCYFAGEHPDACRLSLAPLGGEFRQAVWRQLCKIPYGCTATYGGIARELSEELGKTVSSRAVGGAVGHNPISIIIPCHRVLGADGSLRGYAGGIDRKRWLLLHEGVRLSPPPSGQTP